LRLDEGHVRVPFFVEICINHDPHGPGVSVDREFAVGIGLVLVEGASRLFVAVGGAGIKASTSFYVLMQSLP
jgi:hypothetical protein